MMTFPLQSASVLTSRLLLVDAGGYLYSVNRFKFTGEEIDFAGSPPPLYHQNWAFSAVYKDSTVTVFNRFLGTLILKNFTGEVQEAIIYRVFEIARPTVKVAFFNASNPLARGHNYIPLEKMNGTLSNDYWISSVEENFFYQLSFNATNKSTELFKFSVTFDKFKMTFSRVAVYTFCAHSGNSIYLAAQPLSSKTCANDQSLFSAFALKKKTAFTGFTDKVNFYLIGADQVFIFAHSLDKSDAFVNVRKKPIKSFVTNGAASLISSSGSSIINGTSTANFFSVSTILLAFSLAVNAFL